MSRARKYPPGHPLHRDTYPSMWNLKGRRRSLVALHRDIARPRREPKR